MPPPDHLHPLPHLRGHLLPLLLLLLLLPACTAVDPLNRSHPGSSGGEGYSAAEIRARYRAVQAAQRPKGPPSEIELVPVLRPAREDAGVLREGFIEYLPVLRRP